MPDMMTLVLYTAVGFVAFFAIFGFVAGLYKRASKEISFVRTGFGGQKVIMNGGALIMPVLHETIPVNMNTLRLEVLRANEQALITKDRMRVDVQAEFFVRVQPTTESIANAAQTLGKRTMDPEALKALVEGKFVDALRAVAAEMAMEELHEQRVSFVQKVQAAVSEDILKNGLELESVSLTGLDQTNKDYFNPDNAFDAEGLTKLTQEIEERRKKRNDIEQETEVLIRRKNLEAEQESLQISRDQEYARLEQQREVQTRSAEQAAQIAAEQAMREREAEIAKITASQRTREADIESNKIVAERQIAMDKEVREQEILKEQTLESAAVEKAKQVQLAEQERDIVVAEKSRDKSEAEAEADKARALAAKAAEEVITARQAEVAERDKRIELIDAAKAAEMEAIAVTVAAEAEKQAATDRAEAVRIAANADAEKIRIAAEGDAEAEKMRAEAQERVYAVEAEGQRAVNEAANILSPEQIAMQVKLQLMESLPEIIAQSVKPIENIDGIKILHVDGLGGGANGGPVNGAASGEGGLADQVVSSALRYRAQAPLLDAMLSEIGLKAGDPASLENALNGAVNGEVAEVTDAEG
ncbi:MAG: flotillin domain-containing protein [Maricaulis sp.]|uniref:flotillin family protein n=1 Tax=Maricaulis sp. TaxID=1486257 RepID=UPI001B132C79|nr:flotillin domain-containing protein [Maricaulis sp.]MBO6730617.1 flotillin family protein [Maricaulis sp.]MBO6846961.1 flotillin family protein [Maricaulis sp.]MBO6876320.1 flotillin family protein [Maricaulis sp.]MDM7984556.1 flotillin domain-containing protein [Maricaulis sp.]